MSFYKEAMYAIAKLPKMQKQIYSDACDYGIPIFDFKSEPVNYVKQLIEMYGPVKRRVNRYSTGKSVEITITMIDEFGDCEEFEVVIGYVTTKNNKKGMLGYITLASDGDRWLTGSDNKYLLTA